MLQFLHKSELSNLNKLDMNEHRVVKKHSCQVLQSQITPILEISSERFCLLRACASLPFWLGTKSHLDHFHRPSRMRFLPTRQHILEMLSHLSRPKGSAAASKIRFKVKWLPPNHCGLYCRSEGGESCQVGTWQWLELPANDPNIRTSG